MEKIKMTERAYMACRDLAHITDALESMRHVNSGDDKSLWPIKDEEKAEIVERLHTLSDRLFSLIDTSEES